MLHKIHLLFKGKKKSLLWVRHCLRTKYTYRDTQTVNIISKMIEKRDKI